MSDESAVFVPVGRPVRSFVLVLLAISLLLLALWWSALLWPRLAWGGGSSGTFDAATNRGTSTVTVRNTGPLMVELVDAGVETVGPNEFTATDASFDTLRVAPGESQDVTISYVVESCARGGLTVWFSVRTPSGVVRTVRHRGLIQNPVSVCS